MHLDALRGIAALLVAVSHLRALFFVEFEHVTHKSFLIKMFYALTGLGHDSVMIFFVLSGYLISSSVLRSIRLDRWDWKRYSIQRLTRLYVVLLPALLIGGSWDFLGAKLLGGGVYAGGGPYQHIVSAPVLSRLTLHDWIANALFTQGIIAPTFGSNGPLWSLSYEFWYYVLFPLLLIAVWPGTSPKLRIGYLLLSAAVLIFVGKAIALYFTIWLVGFVVGIVPASKLSRNRAFRAAALCCLVGSLILSRLHAHGNSFVIDAVIALCVALVVYSVLGEREDGSGNALYNKAAHGLSNISYTMYLVHVPFLVFVNSRVIGKGQLWQPDPKHLLLAAAIGGSVLLYTLIVWKLTESRTEEVRRVVSGEVRKKKIEAEKKTPINVG
jgi:peptidoglycan/LPS O-acetylase OafA/YrhL